MNRKLATTLGCLVTTLAALACPMTAMSQPTATLVVGTDGNALAATADALPQDPESTTRAGRYASPQQAYHTKHRLGAAVLLVDVRSPEARRRSAIDVAADLQAPMWTATGRDLPQAFVASVDRRVAGMPRGRATPVLLLCEDGRMAAFAAEALAEAGYTNAIVITGGLHGEADSGRPGWIAAGLPTVKRLATTRQTVSRGPGDGPLTRSF